MRTKRDAQTWRSTAGFLIAVFALREGVSLDEPLTVVRMSHAIQALIHG